jgi:NADH-quinone oxidoreductase subunit H
VTVLAQTSIFDSTFGGYWIPLILKALLALTIFLVVPLVVGYMEHKVLAHMQARLGPMEAGGFHGWAQLMADGAKFIQKEDIVPAAADRTVFSMAPGVALVPYLVVLVVIPFGETLYALNLDIGIFFVLAMTSVGVLGVLMAGWSSANKFSLMGALRAAAQLIAYELPLVLAVVGVVIQAGTMSLQGIVHFQQDGSIFGWSGVGFPLILTQFLGFGIFLIAAQAELTQTPFDMPVAESELVAGYMVEYTGFRFLFFFMGELGTAFAFAGIAATLFLGGWSVPWVHGTMADVLGPIVLFTKIMIVSFLIFWARFTYPRFREDQLQAIAWKYLIPLSLVNILATGVFKVVF